jgi:hypothetical protein
MWRANQKQLFFLSNAEQVVEKRLSEKPVASRTALVFSLISLKRYENTSTRRYPNKFFKLFIRRFAGYKTVAKDNWFFNMPV